MPCGNGLSHIFLARSVDAGARGGDFDGVGYESVKDQNGTNKDIPYLIDDDGKQGPRVLYEGTFGDFSIAASMSDGRGTKDGKDTYEAVTAKGITFKGPKSTAAPGAGYEPSVTVPKGTKFPVTQTKGEDQKNQKFDQELALAAAYSFGNYTVGIGYERIDAAGDGKDKTQFMLNGEATFGDTTVKLAYAKGNKAIWDNAGDIAEAESKAKTDTEASAEYKAESDKGKQKDMVTDAQQKARQKAIDKTGYDGLDKWYGVGVSSVFGATTLTGYVQYKDFDAKTKKDVTWYGIGASYDLGGGATLAAGLAKSDAKGKDDVTADLGIKFKF
eukprot:g9176.t1